MKALVFDVGGTLIKSALYDEENELINYEENEYPKVGRDGILQIITEKANREQFDCIGISTAGLVDEENGSIIFSSSAIYQYTGTKLKDIFEEKYKKPVYVLNDVNAAALGEAYFGSGKNYKDFICMTFGTGVGGAIVHNKKIYAGNTGLAGEVGHMIVHHNGRQCPCGAKGCYNEYASARALVNSCKLVDDKLLDGKRVFEEFYNGKSEIIKIVDLWIDEIVLGLINITHILNPSAFVLGGGIMNEKYITDEISKKLVNSIMPGYRNVRVLKAKLGNKAGLMGAAKLALECLR